jgi:hypothetical protein
LEFNVPTTESVEPNLRYFKCTDYNGLGLARRYKMVVVDQWFQCVVARGIARSDEPSEHYAAHIISTVSTVGVDASVHSLLLESTAAAACMWLRAARARRSRRAS